MTGVLQRLVMAFVSLMTPLAAAASPPDALGSAPLPGGVEGLRRALDHRAAMSPATVVVDLTRRFYNHTEVAADRDPGYARFQAWLRDAAAPTGAGAHASAADTVPLPGDPEFWRLSGLQFDRPGNVVLAVLRSRGAAFLYTALLSMDEDTRAWFVERPQLITSWSEIERGTLLVAAPYLRMAAGRWELPGGREAGPVWAHLVGVEPDAPEAFVAALLRSHSGSLAFLIEVIATLSDEQRRAALTPDPAEARALLSAVREFVGAWRPGERPFSRPSPDPALLLAQIPIRGDGRLALPGSRRFWEFVLDDDDLGFPHERAESAWRDDGPVSPAWLVGRLARTPVDDQAAVYQQLLFAARWLADEPATAAAAVATTLRGHVKFAPLMRVLERLEVDDAATLARVVRQADALTRPAEDWRSRARLVQWQATLALLDRIAHQGVLAKRERAAAVDTLTRPGPPTSRAWREWLAAIVPEMPLGADLAERRVERALLARLVASPVAARPVVWEGTSYLLDLGAAERDRIARVRGRDSRPLLDAAVVLEDWLGRADSAAPGDLLRLLTTLSAAAGLDRPPAPDDEFVRLARVAATRARRALSAAGSGRVPASVLADVSDLAQAVATLALAEFAYASTMGWAGDLPLTAAAASRRHVFIRPYGPGRHRFWATPAISADRRLPWHVSGSLLGLDIALAPVGLRRLSLRPPAEAPSLNTGDRAILVATAAAVGAPHFGDEAQQIVVRLVRQARDRIENVGDRREARQLGVLAGVSGHRIAAAEWLFANDRNALGGLFSMTELVRIGLAGKPTPAALDGWGNYEMALSGRSRAGRFPDLPVERYAGRSRRLLAAALPELQLTLAIRLADLRLPATLVPALMASATLDVVNTTPSRFADDWQAIVDRVRAIDAHAVERYLGLLTTTGPLRRLPVVQP
jgi:hypothetical protein